LNKAIDSGRCLSLATHTRPLQICPHDPAISEAEAKVAWVEQSQAVMVAVDAAGVLVDTCYLRPNSLALGAHVAKAGYLVAEYCRRQGIGSRLCQHSLQAARRLGFRLMQFTLVVRHQHRRHPLLAAQRLSGRWHSAGGVPQPGDDLRLALEAWMGEQEELAGCLISAIGSLSLAQLRRLAGAHHRRAGDRPAAGVALPPGAGSSHRPRRAADQSSGFGMNVQGSARAAMALSVSSRSGSRCWLA